MTLRSLLFIAVATLAALCAVSRTRTTQSHLRTDNVPVEVLITGDSIEGVNASDITLRGFAKRASDSKESFFITNNTTHRMSAVRLLLRYTTMSGEMLTQRTVTVPVSLKPGESRIVSFTIDADLLKFYNKDLEFVCEPGDFEAMVGPNSRDVQRQTFSVK